jgi:hypothetical protein
VSLKVVSFPEPLTTWDPADAKQYFYFELVGEASPALDDSQGELAATPKADAGGVTGTRVYEYVWTIGRLGVWQHRPETPHGLAHRSQGDEAFSDIAPEVTPSVPATDFWGKLKDPAAHVYVYFPLAESWRVSELGATVKYLSPMPDDETFLDRTAKDVQALQPIVGAVGQLANVAAPGAGAVISSSARVIGALAQMKTNSLPQTAAFPWAVAKTTFIWTRKEGGVEKKTPMAGVAWSLPKTMFEELGGRISGSVAVIFVPVTAQKDRGITVEQGTNQDTKPEPPAPPILARAIIHGPDPIRSPPEDPDGGFIKLQVAPAVPPTGSQTTSGP